MEIKNIKYKKIVAFSLAEAMISMMIIMISIMCAAPIMTKQKNSAGLKHTTVKGSYTCYPEWVNKKIDNITISGYMFRSMYCEEEKCKFSECACDKGKDDCITYSNKADENGNKTKVESVCINGEKFFAIGCKMMMNPRAAHYLMIATGAGYYDKDSSGNEHYGSAQVVTQYIRALSDNINICPGVDISKRAFDENGNVNESTNPNNITQDEMNKIIKELQLEKWNKAIANMTVDEINDYKKNNPINEIEIYPYEIDAKKTEYLRHKKTDINWDSRKTRYSNTGDDCGNELAALPGYYEKNELTKDNINNVYLLNPDVAGCNDGKLSVSYNEGIITLSCERESESQSPSAKIAISKLEKVGNYYTFKDGNGSGKYKFNIELRDSNYKSGESKQRFSEILKNMSPLRMNNHFYTNVIAPQYGGVAKQSDSSAASGGSIEAQPGAATILW